MNPKDFHRTLPKKRMAAGAILRDASGRVLLVEPTYKAEWEIPGGVIEADESPLFAVIRELREEIGLPFRPEEFGLITVDYLYESPERTEALMFLFAGPILESERIAGIELATSELKSFSFLSLAEARRRLGPILVGRLERALSAIAERRCSYFEDRVE